MGKLIDWYINGEYHCDNCPFCWGGNYCPGCDDYDDCGCYIKGDIQDTCRLIPPIRFILGWSKRKKARYYENHQYDNIGGWFEKDQSEQKEFERLLLEWLDGYELSYKSHEGKVYPYDKYDYVRSESWRIRHRYDEYAHPVIRKNLKQQWKEVIVNTFLRIVGYIKPYICK